MKVISVTGLTGSGKTTTIEKIIAELTARGFSVGSVKEIHFEAFQIDTEGKNTYRHRQAGANTVTALGYRETDVMYKGKMPIYDLLRHYTEDFVVLEGVRNAVVPNIAVSRADAQPEISPLTIAVSGVYAGAHSGEYNGLPIINAMTDVKKLVDLILEKTPELMQDFDKECCGHCGYDCKGLLAEILKGGESIEKCVLNNRKVRVTSDGKEIQMVPFVEKLVKNAVLGVVSELKGYKKGAKIEVSIED